MRGRLDGRGTAVVAIALAVGLVAGCTGDKTESSAPGTTVASTEAPSSAMPSGTSVSASSAGSSVSSPASPSVTADLALVAEAKKVHSRFVETEDAVAYIGGLPPGSKPPKEFTELLMEDGLSHTMSSMNETFKAGVKRKSGETEYGPVRVIGLEKNGSIITLRGCRDGRGLLIARADGSTYNGILVRHTTYYKRDRDGRLKINFWTSVEDPKCR